MLLHEMHLEIHLTLRPQVWESINLIFLTTLSCIFSYLQPAVPKLICPQWWLLFEPSQGANLFSNAGWKSGREETKEARNHNHISNEQALPLWAHHTQNTRPCDGFSLPNFTSRDLKKEELYLTLLLIDCVTLSKILNFSEPQSASILAKWIKWKFLSHTILHRTSGKIKCKIILKGCKFQ